MVGEYFIDWIFEWACCVTPAAILITHLHGYRLRATPNLLLQFQPVKSYITVAVLKLMQTAVFNDPFPPPRSQKFL